METTIYLEFNEDNVPSNPYSVKLASQNPSDNFGILDMTTQTAAVAWGTSIIPYQTGRYSYTLTVENGHSYFVAWEIVGNVGEDPTYKTDQIGPFFSVDNNAIRAVSSFGGKFVQGSRATVMLKVTSFNGMPIDAESISIALYDADGTVVSLDNVTPDNADTGFYVYDWVIPATQAPGEYTIVWSYVVDDIEKAEVQYVVVSEDATDTLLYSGRVLDFRLALEHHLACAQSIPVYYEQAKPTRDYKTYRFSFKKWNQSTDLKIYRNGNVVNSGVEVDYFKGTVTFDEALAAQETVNVDYNFKWFSDDELNRFLFNAVQTVNIYPPQSIYTLETVLDRYIPIVLYGAAKDALRHLMMCLQFQQPQQVFGGSDNAQKAFQAFDTLKQNYEKDWEKLLDQKKFGPYPSTHMVVVPEYTLPGGRCLCLETTALCSVNDVFSEIKNVGVYTLSQIYKMFKEGLYIQILSHSDFTGNMVFAPINHIWKSGEKDVYRLKTRKGYDIRTSDEHLFFVNGKYIPLRFIKEGDNVVICDHHSVEQDRIKSIQKIKGKEVMYDLEVFGTKNLFANGIKCHNSRWFRYLFKG